MPTVEMPAPPPAEATESSKLPDSDDKDILNQIMNDVEVDDRDDAIISVTERVIPTEDDVFDEPVIKPVLEEQKEEQVNTEYIDPEKKGKRKYTRKAPMSEKQKEHLAKIRKIAQEKRKAEKERKAAEKEEAQLKKVEERLLKKKQKEEEKSVEEKPPPAQPKKSYTQQKMYTEEDLNRAILAGVSTYDTYRKQQKKEKRAKQEAEASERKMKETIQRAITPQQNTADPWRSLFG